MRVAVAGGTGRVGRFVVQTLARNGDDPVVLARSAGVDLMTGTGLDAALVGVEGVIDVTNASRVRRAAAVERFGRMTAALLAAGERAGVRHHVLLSIVGVDRVPLGYYTGKLEQERRVLAGPVPASVLRSTQFHEYVDLVLGLAPGPLAPVPRMRIQPIAAREVAAALADLVHDEAAHDLVPDIAGPRVHELPDLARRALQARGSHRLVMPLRLPGAAGRAMRTGDLLPPLPGPRGRQSFREWLEDPARPTP